MVLRDWKTVEYDGARISVPPTWTLLRAGACPGRKDTILTFEEIAYLFASCVDERNGYLTGVDIVCDGGLVASGMNPLK